MGGLAFPGGCFSTGLQIKRLRQHSEWPDGLQRGIIIPSLAWTSTFQTFVHEVQQLFKRSVAFFGSGFSGCGLGGSLVDFGLGNGRGAVPLLVAFMSSGPDSGFAIGAAGELKLNLIWVSDC